MSKKNELLNRSETALESIISNCIGMGWLTSKQISELICVPVTPHGVGTLLSKAVKSGKIECGLQCEYFGSDRKMWKFTDEITDSVKPKTRPQGLSLAPDEKKMICEKFCGAGWFYSNEVVDFIGLSNKKTGGILRSLKEKGFTGYIIEQDTIQKRWVHRIWRIEKDEPIKPKKSILTMRWV